MSHERWYNDRTEITAIPKSFQSYMSATDQVAVQHAECSICFDPLYQRDCVVLRAPDTTHRACMHAFHADCVESITAHDCPICRQPYVGTIVVPNALTGIVLYTILLCCITFILCVHRSVRLVYSYRYFQ